MSGQGAALGFKLALVYASAFVLAASIRYGGDLAAHPPGGSLWPTYLGGVVSLAVAAFGIALILGLAAAALGAITALLAASINHQFNAERNRERSALIGLGVAGLFVLFLHTALWSAGLWSWPSLGSTTYLFWLGGPAAIYLVAAWRAGSASTQ